MARRFTLAEIRSRTYKRRDAWWTVWLVDPLASRLVRLVAPWRWATPNRLTTLAFLIGAGAACCYWRAGYAWLVAGAVLFHVSFVLDCMDGKIARLNGTGSVFGSWLDYVLDRLRVLICAVALFAGQYRESGDFVYVWLAGLVIFLDMFRYLNALQMGKVKAEMRQTLEGAYAEETADELPAGAAGATDVYGEFRARFRAFVRVRNALVRQRIRVHLVSGIEFMMFVFIVGPVLHAIVATTVTAAALLVGFELLLIYKLWTAAKSFTAAAVVPEPRSTTGHATRRVP
jgi:phosphatidylglycerophosphate synthase